MQRRRKTGRKWNPSKHKCIMRNIVHSPFRNSFDVRYTHGDNGVEHRALSTRQFDGRNINGDDHRVW